MGGREVDRSAEQSKMIQYQRMKHLKEEEALVLKTLRPDLDYEGSNVHPELWIRGFVRIPLLGHE